MCANFSFNAQESLGTLEATVRVGADLSRRVCHMWPAAACYSMLETHALNSSVACSTEESLERREELLTQQEQLAAARWILCCNFALACQTGCSKHSTCFGDGELRTAEMDDLRHASNFQQEILAKQREGGKPFRTKSLA